MGIPTGNRGRKAEEGTLQKLYNKSQFSWAGQTVIVVSHFIKVPTLF
jgi:hypothetical protein